MQATFSIANILMAALVAVVVMVNAPVLVGGVTAIEAGKYRVAWTRYGWSYQYEWKNGGTMKTVTTAEGYQALAPVSIYKSGFWPWYRRPE